MAVLGIDLSIVKCGLAVYDGGLLMMGSVNLKSKDPGVLRRHQVLTYVQRAVLTFPDIKTICMEDVRTFFHGPHLQSIAGLVALGTTVEDWAFGRFIPVVRVIPQTWRKIVLGSGRARKQDAVDFVLRTFKRAVAHDAAEAACLAMYPYLKGLEAVDRG